VAAVAPTTTASIFQLIVLLTHSRARRPVVIAVVSTAYGLGRTAAVS
jgi:hypothetical protein